MKYYLCILGVALLSGCQTTYQAMNLWDGLGYEDQKLQDGIFEISYLVNAKTPKEKALELWHMRATELCGHSNYKADVILTYKLNYNSAGIYSSTHKFPKAIGKAYCNGKES